MKDLWSNRFTKYLNELGKYGRLIMNDHFSIILLIILAFVGLYYRDLLLQLQSMDLSLVRWPILLGVTAWLMVAFQYGRPLWLTKDPDKSYLFARGADWQLYWLKGTLVSLVMPTILVTLATAMIMPFLELVTAWTIGQSWILIVFLILFKVGSFLITYLSIFGFGGKNQFFGPQRTQHTLVMGLVIFVSFLLPNPTNIIWLALVTVMLAGLILYGMIQRNTSWMAFDYVVDQEILREANYYKWISVFADVPHMKPSVKRRAYLDTIFNRLAFFNRDRYSFLFIRAIFRNNAYSGVWVRVMLFIMVLLAFTESYWLAFGLGVVGHLLTVVQLIPLLQAYRNNPFQLLYPNRESSSTKSFQNALFLIVFIQCIGYGLVSLFNLGMNFNTLIIFLAWVLIGLSLAFFYVPWWHRRQKNK